MVETLTNSAGSKPLIPRKALEAAAAKFLSVAGRGRRFNGQLAIVRR